jgi:hypothetical protein
MTPTIDDIQWAYAEIEAVPIAGEYFERRANVPHCCPMSALYAQKFGLEATEAMIDEGIFDPDRDEGSICKRFCDGLNLPPQFVDGFIAAVDGGGYVRDDPDFQSGFELGATFRDQVLIGG